MGEYYIPPTLNNITRMLSVYRRACCLEGRDPCIRYFITDPYIRICSPWGRVNRHCWRAAVSMWTKGELEMPKPTTPILVYKIQRRSKATERDYTDYGVLYPDGQFKVHTNWHPAFISAGNGTYVSADRELTDDVDKWDTLRI